ncbi:MAG TPA: ABC transporter ATP-binding protein [Acidimicrobiales bacterium]|nr:ABC transporter ATP-binding protein [Acidimicrobiales bacterium]
MLECWGLRKQFGERIAVDDVSFRVSDNECYGLLGPNGAGKTTTISMLCGLIVPDDGTVTVNGFAGGTLDAKGALGYVPQDIALYPDLSARENLEFFGQLYGLKGRLLKERIDDTLDLVGLSERGTDKVGTYSGGMKRRANIAAGLLHHPQLLVLDEPTVGVDPQSRNAILETVGALGIAVLYTTHYMEEAAKLCDRVGIINDGRLIAEGTPAELIRAHGGHDRVRLTGASDGLGAIRETCAKLGAVVALHATDDGLELTTPDGAAILPDLVELAGRLGVQLTGIEVLAPDLEGVFLALTGKELRD